MVKAIQCNLPSVRYEGKNCIFLRKVDGKMICGKVPCPIEVDSENYGNDAVLMWRKTCIGLLYDEVKKITHPIDSRFYFDWPIKDHIPTFNQRKIAYKKGKLKTNRKIRK